MSRDKRKTLHFNRIFIYLTLSIHQQKAWFSNKGYHALPTFINALDNTLLRAMIPPEMGNPAAYGKCIDYNYKKKLCLILSFFTYSLYVLIQLILSLKIVIWTIIHFIVIINRRDIDNKIIFFPMKKFSIVIIS